MIAYYQIRDGKVEPSATETNLFTEEIGADQFFGEFDAALLPLIKCTCKKGDGCNTTLSKHCNKHNKDTCLEALKQQC